MTAVYQIRNTETGRVYVGSTTDLKNRWHCHKTALNGGKHPVRELQADWARLGAAQFLVDILEEAAGDRAQGREREEVWIGTRRDEGTPLYNTKAAHSLHGTYSRYVNGERCRCDECKAAASALNRARYLVRKQQDGPYWLHRPRPIERIRPPSELAAAS